MQSFTEFWVFGLSQQLAAVNGTIASDAEAGYTIRILILYDPTISTLLFLSSAFGQWFLACISEFGFSIRKPINTLIMSLGESLPEFLQLKPPIL